MLRPGRKFYQRPGIVGTAVVSLAALVTIPTTLALTARAGTESTPKAVDVERTPRSFALHYVVRGRNIIQEKQDLASYAIHGLAPGEYTVTAIEHPWFGPFTIQRQQSKPLALRAGEKAVLDFDLRTSATSQDEPAMQE